MRVVPLCKGYGSSLVISQFMVESKWLPGFVRGFFFQC